VHFAAPKRRNFKAAAVSQLIRPSNIAKRSDPACNAAAMHVLVGEGRAALWSRRNGEARPVACVGGENGAGVQREESGPLSQPVSARQSSCP
jgi:hypothetical protein